MFSYRHQKKYDSCFQIKRDMIAFSSRRGLDTKGDSLALGIDMFYSPYRFQSKPYLLKVLDIEASDIMIGQVMMLDKFKISTVDGKINKMKKELREKEECIIMMHLKKNFLK